MNFTLFLSVDIDLSDLSSVRYVLAYKKTEGSEMYFPLMTQTRLYTGLTHSSSLSLSELNFSLVISLPGDQGGGGRQDRL